MSNAIGDLVEENYKLKEEIERLNNQLDFIKDQNKYIDKLEKMVKERNSIIKEVREYMNNLRWFEMVSNDVDMTLYASTKNFWHDISGILDKVEEKI